MYTDLKRRRFYLQSAEANMGIREIQNTRIAVPYNSWYN